MIVAIVCSTCGGVVIEPYPHPLDMPCFICRKCRLILEPPNGMRTWIQTSPLPPNE